MNQNDQMREALRMYMSAGSGNSTDFDLQAKAWSMAHEALNHTPDTGTMVGHVGDANKMVRLTDEGVADEYNKADSYLMLCDEYEFDLVANAIMDAMIKKNGG